MTTPDDTSVAPRDILIGLFPDDLNAADRATPNVLEELLGEDFLDFSLLCAPGAASESSDDAAMRAQKAEKKRAAAAAKKARHRERGDRPIWPALTRLPTADDDERYAAALHLARTIDLTAADPPDLPPLHELRLAGVRRAKEGRGGATGIAVTMRTVIRSPFLRVLGVLFPDCKNTGGRPGTPAEYWLFFAAIARELGSNEAATEEIIEHFDRVVRPEFAAIRITLPTRTTPRYSGFKNWRKTHVVDAGRLDPMNRLFTVLSLRLHLAIATVHGVGPASLLDPVGARLLICDSSVFDGPSSVFMYCPLCGKDADVAVCPHPVDMRVANHTKAKELGRERLHERPANYDAKEHGRKIGFQNVAVSAKNQGMYARTILAVDLGGCAEMELSMPLLAHVLELADPNWFVGLAYDGLLLGTHHLELQRRYGIPVINLPSARNRKVDAESAAGIAGQTTRAYGKYKGKAIGTYTFFLRTITHTASDGSPCHHHLISDDGAVYDSPNPPTARLGQAAIGARRGNLLSPADMVRTREADGTWRITLTLTVPCTHGDQSAEFVLTDSVRNTEGEVPRSEPIEAVRHVFEAERDRWRAIAGIRNNAESIFDWLEQRFYRKDRHAAWGRDAQLLDLMCAGILCNSECWAHAVPLLRRGALIDVGAAS